MPWANCLNGELPEFYGLPSPQEPSGAWPRQRWQCEVAVRSDALIPSQNHSTARTQIENSLTGQRHHPTCS